MENANNYAWKIESLRLSSFLKNESNNSQLENWLKEISKNEPLSINKNVNQFRGIAQVESSMLNLTWNNNRIDLLLNSNAPNVEKNIGDNNDIIRLMNDVLFGYFDVQDCPVSNRLAIGIILNIPIKTLDEGANVLQPKLKSVTNLKGTSDFLYRNNRPTKSKIISGLGLNRLMTWSIAQMQLVNIQFNVGQPNIAQPKIDGQKTNPELMCRLEMDFSTIVDDSIEMSADQQKLIAKEILTEAMKVVENGEFGIEK